MLLFTKFMATLQNFSLVAKVTNGEIYSMHRLVQVSVQIWLELQKTAFRWRREALFTLAKLFFHSVIMKPGVLVNLLPHTHEESYSMSSSQAIVI